MRLGVAPELPERAFEGGVIRLIVLLQRVDVEICRCDSEHGHNGSLQRFWEYGDDYVTSKPNPPPSLASPPDQRAGA
jgi:hypothetical protein